MNLSRKAISPVVAMALLLTVAVVSGIGFQAWYNNYSSTILADVEGKDSNLAAVNIELLTENEIYVYSEDNVSVEFLIINDNLGNTMCEYNRGYFDNDSLVDHWSFDNREGTNIPGELHRVNGTIANTPVISAGIVGNGIRFDSSDDYVVYNSQLTEFEDNLSFSGWVQSTNTTGTENLIFSKTSGSVNRNFQILTRNGELRFLNGNGASNVIQTTGFNIYNGAFRHVAFTANSTNYTFYVDGVNISSGALTFPIQDNLVSDNFTRIGAIVGFPSTQLYGTADEYFLFNKTLNLEGIQNLYNFNALNLTLDEGTNEINIPGCNLTTGNAYQVSLFTLGARTEKEFFVS